MFFLARKIARAKWDPKADLAKSEVPADAVTSDLKTTNNTLSFWKCGNASENELKMVALALAAAAERVDKIDVVWVLRSNLDEQQIDLQESDGRTPVQKMVKEHVDAWRLDLIRLGGIAREVALAIRKGHHYRLTRKEVVQILRDAVRAGLLPPDTLGEKVRTEIEL